jgi:transcription antitermination factor NusG
LVASFTFSSCESCKNKPAGRNTPAPAPAPAPLKKGDAVRVRIGVVEYLGVVESVDQGSGKVRVRINGGAGIAPEYDFSDVERTE